MLEFTWQSFAFALANFLILAWLLTKLLHRPLLGVLNARKQKLADTRKSAEDEKTRAEQLRAEYEGKVEAASEERDRLLVEARETAENAGRAVVEKATGEARQAEVDKLRQAYDQERREAMQDVQEELVDVAVRIAQGVLEKLTGTDLEAKLHAQLLAELDALDAGAGTEQAGLPVRVSSARPLTDAAKRDIEARVRAHVGNEAEILFAEDAGLVAGARLEFSSIAIEANLSDVLTRVREQALAPTPLPAADKEKSA